jgi:hypothetical protein
MSEQELTVVLIIAIVVLALLAMPLLSGGIMMARAYLVRA